MDRDTFKVSNFIIKSLAQRQLNILRCRAIKQAKNE